MSVRSSVEWRYHVDSQCVTMVLLHLIITWIIVQCLDKSIVKTVFNLVFSWHFISLLVSQWLSVFDGHCDLIGSITFLFLVCVVREVFKSLLYIARTHTHAYTHKHTQTHTHIRVPWVHLLCLVTLCLLVGLAFSTLVISYLMASMTSSYALGPNSYVL